MLHYSCKHFNHGGTNGNQSYEKSYGARCELHNKFFFEMMNHCCSPDCVEGLKIDKLFYELLSED